MRILRALLLIFITVGLGLFLAVMLPAYRSGTRLLSVQTNSMEPVFAHGDGVVMRPAHVSELKIDDVISYRSSADPQVIISHRLIDIDAESGLLYTQGDNTELVDNAVDASLVLGRVTQVIPRAGYVIDFLHKPIGLITAIYLPGMLILISEARRLARRYARPVYQLPSYRQLKHRRV